MAITLPLPLRVAAGILGTGIDLVRSLPDDIPALPVTLVGNAMKLSIKVQQEIASLANRGDELLGGVIGGPEENPAWAKFDDDEPVRPVTRMKPPATPGSKASAPARPGRSGSPAAAPAPTPTPPDLNAGVAAELSTPEATAIPPVMTTAMEAAIDVSEDLVEAATLAAGDSPDADPTSGAERVAAAHQRLDAEEVASLGAFEAGQVPDEVLDSVVIGETEELTESPQVPTSVIEEALIEEALIEAEAIEEAAIEDAAAQEALIDEATVEQAVLEAAMAESEAATLLEDIADIEAAEELAAEVADAEATEELLAEVADSEAAEELVADSAGFDSAEQPEVRQDGPVVIGETAELTAELPITDALIEEVAEESDGPEALPDYDRMTLAQVRGHLRELSAAEVSALLRYEQDGDSRPPFLTLLSNRLVTLDAQNQ